MSMQSIIQLAGRWIVFDNDTVTLSTTRPRVEQPAWLFCEFEGGVSSVVSLEGSPAHAVALIEKRLRADGMIDGDGKILIHKSRTMGAGYQSLFTAVPLDVWQQTFAWAEAQPDHCLLVPITSLMWNAIKSGEGLVVQNGRQFSVLALRKHDIIYRASMAYSEDATDLAMTVGALAGQVADDLARNNEDGSETMVFQWCPLLMPQPLPGESTSSETLAEIFSANTGCQVRQVPTRTYRDNDGGTWLSAIDWVRSRSSTRIAVNPLPSRAAHLAEWALPLASCASLVFAIALGALGARWALAAGEADDRAAQINQQIVQLEQQTQALAGDVRLPQGFDAALEFIEKAKGLSTGMDPVSGLQLIQEAAQDEVRILRLRVEQPADAAGQAGTNPPADSRTLRVDGMVDIDRGTPGMQVAHFVERLRRQGFNPVPLDPQSGGGTRTSNGGIFSYLLSRTPSSAVEPTP